MVNNPIALLLSCEENIFLCIGKVVSIHIRSKAIDYLQLDVLLKGTVHVTYQVYSLVYASPNNDNPEDNAQQYKWHMQNLMPMKFKVPDNLILPINPSLSMPPSRTLFYLFETAMLIAFTLLRYCRNICPTWVLFYSSDTKKCVELELLVLRPTGS
jgi:hypothetical protein